MPHYPVIRAFVHVIEYIVKCMHCHFRVAILNFGSVNCFMKVR